MIAIRRVPSFSYRFLCYTTFCCCSGPDSDMLPSASTCFNVLHLPEYASR